MNKSTLVKAMRLIEADGLSVTDACKQVGVSRTTFYNHKERLTTDARVSAVRVKNEQRIDSDIDTILDTQQERAVDLGILNHLLGRLVEGIEKGHWSPDEVERRLVGLVEAKQKVLGGVDRANQLVGSLTLVDARSVTVGDIPEDVRRTVTDDVCADIWTHLCEGCKDAISIEVKGETRP